MPYARISLLAGQTDEYLDAISKSLHAALVETFDVPPDDYFQIFHSLRPAEFRFATRYLGGPRTERFVHIALTTGKPRSEETKRRFYRCLVDRLGASPGLGPEDVLVVISTSQSEDWSFGGGRMWQPQNSKS